MYRDEIEKLETYKQKIITDFIQQGIYPNNLQIQEALAHIDLKFSYLKTEKAISGKAFDTEAYNTMIKALFEDFKLLYQLLKIHVDENYESLKIYADTHLKSLEEKTEFYLEKSEQEVATTSLGKTIAFIKSPFVTNQLNTTLSLKLGTYNLLKGSKVYVLVNGINLNNKQCTIKYSGNNKTTYVNPYNFSHESFTIPGVLAQTAFEYTIIRTQMDTIACIPHPVKAHCNYVVLAGKNKLSMKEFESGSVSTNYVSNKHYSFTANLRTYFDFYTCDVKAIRFRFSKQPLASNFTISENPITNLEPLQHFFVEMPEDSFFEIYFSEGCLYSGKQEGLVKENKLYYPQTTSLDDFKVIEIKTDDTMTFDIACEMYGTTVEDLSVTSCLIKQSI